MTYDAKEIAQITKGLSDQMVNALLYTHSDRIGVHKLSLYTDQRTRSALQRRGLVRGALTELGLAVRAELLENVNDV